MFNVFIDGKEGTTGLQIYDRLARRDDVNIITLPEDKRKDVIERKACLNEADISFLCLPDDAAKIAVSLVDNPKAKIIDASTAHRTNPDWVYGLPELSQKRRQEIAASNRVANPGCHATGFITLVAPLVSGGLVSPDYPFVAHSISGYSGAGKKAIAEYESKTRDIELGSPREYALGLTHKHLPEMVRECNLAAKPIFNPFICDFYCGMCVTVPLYTRLMNKKYTVNDVREYFSEYYAGQNFIKVIDEENIPKYLPANKLAWTNNLNIYVTGNDEQILLASVFDNLGKGASGAAVQNMNIMLGLDEKTWLL
jgi:N-acetyl-gamma-glutamyl-phosphate reductase